MLYQWFKDLNENHDRKASQAADEDCRIVVIRAVEGAWGSNKR